MLGNDELYILAVCLFSFQSLTSPRKLLLTSNRLSPLSAASTPQRSPASNRKSKLATPVIRTPDEKLKQPNGLIRRDSFHDIGSDSEMDEPFFNFDSEEMDDEELYSESLLEELRKQQVCWWDDINLMNCKYWTESVWNLISFSHK